MNTTQINSCVRATEAMPSILPIMSWKGLTDDTISSSTLLLFSSMTPCMTMVPYMNTNMYMSRPKM